MNDDIRQQMSAEIDRQISEAIYGSAQTNTAPSPPIEPLTIDMLRQIMLKVPKMETWLSTKLFTGAGAMRVEGGGEIFLVAHPMFWARVKYEFQRADELKPANLSGMPPFHGTPIIEIDRDVDETPERALYLQQIWARLKEAADVAMIHLPDWLKSAPLFKEDR